MSKKGFTTGSCAAAASKAAAYMLCTGNPIDKIIISTPAGIDYETHIIDATCDHNDDQGILPDRAGCAVKKERCDDPDVTAGMIIRADLTRIRDGRGDVTIEGGDGIGKITKPGLDRPVGDWAINSVPRLMIEHEVRDVMEEYDFGDSICVKISAPEGEKIAQKTFNPKLGIEGGISIIGTSGIIEPMSTRAIIDTIRVQLRQRKALGDTVAIISPGNYGLDFMSENFGYDSEKAVKCSNYIGDTIDIVKELGFEGMLLVGHIGKLIKLSGGIMNTHSQEADCRMELMAAAAARCQADFKLLSNILDSVSTEEACGYVSKAGIAEECYSYIIKRIDYHLKKRAKGMPVDCIVYSTVYGVLGMTDNAEALMKTAVDSTKEVNIK